MSTAIAIFVKTPRLSPVKTRLAETIGVDKAREFYSLSLKAVQETVESIEASAYWAVAEKEGLDDPLWRSFPRLYTGEGGLGERQHHIYDMLLNKYERVVLIGADTPQFSESGLKQAINALNTHDFAISPARDGGYTLFGGRVPVARDIWTAVPWSTHETRARLEAGLPSEPVRLSVLTDVDTEGDLRYVVDEMPENMNAAQRRVLEWIERDRCLSPSLFSE